MTQINPMNPEEMEKPVPIERAEADLRTKNNARWGAIILTLIGIAMFIFAVNVVTFTDPEDYILVGFPAVMTVLGALSIYLIQRDRVALGAGIIFSMNLLVPLVLTLVVQETFWIAFSYALLTSALLIWHTVPRPNWRWTMIAASSVLVIIGIINIIDSPDRLGNDPRVAGFFTWVVAALFIAVVYQVITEAWNRSYSIGRKLLITFGLLGALTLVVGLIANFGLSNVTNAYDHALEDGGELQAISLKLSNELLTARRLERDFLLLWKEQGFNNAYTNYVLPNEESVVGIRQDITLLLEFAPTVGETFGDTYPQTQYTSDLNTLRESVDSYERNFQRAVRLIEEKGFQDEGLEGEFRAAVRNIEDLIYDRDGLDPLVITMLSIRRHEKDYLLRGDQTYIDQTHESVAELKQQISASDLLNASEKAQMRILADQYIAAFDALVENDFQIAVATQEFNFAAQTMEPIVEKLANTGQEMSAIDIATATAADIQMRTLTTVAMVFALIAAGFLAVFLSRQISQPVTQLTNTAQEIAGGNFNVQAEVFSADEIGSLADTFNAMTKRLGEAFEDVRQRAAELSTVAEVSTATSTILESKQLLQNVVDLTKERFNLYHSHIYLLDEKGENLVLTAGAGEPGRIMVSEGRTIPLSLEQSLVARAARERQGVTVNDVTQAPDHLPNPLLPDTRSELAVPMMVGGNVIGVFDIQSEQVGRFTDTDVNIQTTLAAQLATSIQNVRSFERSKKEAELQSLVNMIGSRIQRATTIEETLQTAIRELGTAIGASRVKAKVGQTNGSSNPTAAD